MEKKLYKSKRDKVIAGVCGGIAEYFDIDSTLVRLFWVLITLAGGAGIIAYIVCVLVFPEGPSYGGNINREYVVQSKSIERDSDEFAYTGNDGKRNSEKNRILAGAILIGLGVIFLIKRYIYWFDFGKLWPLVLIIAGIYIIYKNKGDK